MSGRSVPFSFIYLFMFLVCCTSETYKCHNFARCKNNQSTNPKPKKRVRGFLGSLKVRSQIIPIYIINTIFSGIQESKSQEKLLILWYNYVVFIEWSNKQAFASLEKKEISRLYLLRLSIYILYFALNYSVTLHLFFFII